MQFQRTCLALFVLLFFCLGAECLAPRGWTPAQPTLDPDEFESRLISILDLQDRWGDPSFAYKTTVTFRGKAYPVHFTGVPKPLYDYSAPFFRAGDLFVLNTRFIPRSGTPERLAFDALLEQYPLALFLAEVNEEAGWKAYTLPYISKTNTDLTLDSEDEGIQLFSKYNMLFWITEILIAMQSIRDDIRDRPFLDIGSRNALIANAALKLGASKAFCIENDLRTLSEEETRICFPLEWENTTLAQLEISDSEDLISINRKANRVPQERLVAYPCNVDEVPETHFENAVVAFNFPSYGCPYSNTFLPATGIPKDAVSILPRSKLLEWYGISERKDSLLEDVLRYFRGVRWVIAAGGDTHQLELERFHDTLQRCELQPLGHMDLYYGTQVTDWAARRPDGNIESGTDKEKIFCRTYLIPVPQQSSDNAPPSASISPDLSA